MTKSETKKLLEMKSELRQELRDIEEWESQSKGRDGSLSNFFRAEYVGVLKVCKLLNI